MTKELSIEELAALAAEHEDQTQEVSGGDFEYEIPEAGVTVGRLIEYIELGKHKRAAYMGKPKPDAERVRITFELLHPQKNIKEYEKDGEKRKFAQTISIDLTKSLSDKAKFKKLFKKLTYGRDDKKHIAQLLGEAYVLTIVHNVVKKEGQPDRTYANLQGTDGEFLIGAPFKVDALTGQKEAYNVPERIAPLRLFLWDNPTKGTWDSLFIDGTREVKEADGTVKQVSKNWLQERILSATNYKGSPLNHLLGGAPTGDAITAAEAKHEVAAQAKAEEAAPAVEDDLPPFEPEATAQTATEPTGADVALAALGLLP